MERLADIPVVSLKFGDEFHREAEEFFSVLHMENLALLYGFGHKLASVRTLDIPGRDLRKEVTSPQTIIERVNEVARRCVEDDGAEVILITATLAAVFFSEKEGGPFTDMGVPVVDTMQVGLKMVELMVDMQKLGVVPPVSRIGLWREPYEPEYRKLRAFYGLPLRRGMDRKK